MRVLVQRAHLLNENSGSLSACATYINPELHFTNIKFIINIIAILDKSKYRIVHNLKKVRQNQSIF